MEKILVENIKNEIELAAKELLGTKLDKVVLYGSYARGDYDNESDIDFAVLIKVPVNELSLYNEKIGEITSSLSIKYGILVSLVTISLDTFNEYKETLPFYMNIVKEGVTVYG